MGQEGSSTPGSFSHPQEEHFNDEFPDSALGTRPGLLAPEGPVAVQCWAVWEAHAGTPGWWAQPEAGWQS